METHHQPGAGGVVHVPEACHNCWDTRSEEGCGEAKPSLGLERRAHPRAARREYNKPCPFEPPSQKLMSVKKARVESSSTGSEYEGRKQWIVVVAERMTNEVDNPITTGHGKEAGTG